MKSIAPLCRGGYGSQRWNCILARRRIGKYRSEKEREETNLDDDDFLTTPTCSKTQLLSFVVIGFY